MIVFVDNEHAKGYAQPWGEKLMALVWRIAELLGVERTERIGKKSQVEARTKS